MSRLLPLATALFCVALASLVACKDETPPAEKVIGTWAVDIKAVRAAVPDDDSTRENTARWLDGTLLPLLAQVRVVLTADQVVVSSPGGRTEASTYQVEKVEGDAVTLVWTKNVEPASPIRMTMTVTGDQATLVSSADPSRTTPLKRLAAADAQVSPVAPFTPVAPAPPAAPSPAPAQP
jgi:hypothetical protein